MFARCLPFVTLCFASAALANAAAATTNRLTFDTLPQAHFEFAGPVGDRIQANLDEWLLRAPRATTGAVGGRIRG